MTSQRVKNKKIRHETKLGDMTVVQYTLWRLLWSFKVHTHAQKNVVYLFDTIKMVHWRVYGVYQKRKTSPLTWSDVDLTSSVSSSWSRWTTNENAHISHAIVQYMLTIGHLRGLRFSNCCSKVRTEEMTPP